ncbi:low molecular weight phosphatase family protein [Microbacterium rhizomatis]|uniref:Low molecular weight phosphatase family protein n=1 Tax=Microbacterium rhizomatis TaxID=1631477 RepID=A0A5J5J3K2_9MICO|nr:low molecular weight phosphatase family protein [Microbacterium rhizomatis]KAA9107788.1 low molecular weight phosphatase family protein [Microbacterium rhizomatis]
MFELLTVCTGNICRSPLAELLLRERLKPLPANVSSAGTRGLRDATMTPEAVQIAVASGVASAEAQAHRSRSLTEAQLLSPDLILTMTRDHRREVVELAPSRTRVTFTIREFARIAAQVPDDEVRRVTGEAGPDAAARVRAIAGLVGSYRGLAATPVVPEDEDVIDPYGRSMRTYELAAAQLIPAVDAVVRTLRLGLADPR